MSKKIENFFDKHIVQAHLQSKGQGWIDKEFDSIQESYFSTPVNPEYLYLTTVSSESAEELEIYLKEFWRDEPALQAMIPDLVKLAFSLKDEQKPQSAELSSFIYEMF